MKSIDNRNKETLSSILWGLVKFVLIVLFVIYIISSFAECSQHYINTIGN